MKIEKIYLDTSTIVAENFLAGRKLKELAALSKAGKIDLRLTTITFDEVLKKISEHTTESFLKLNKAHSLLNNQAKILKNIPEYRDSFNFPDYEVTDAIKKIQDDFKTFVKENNIKIFPVDNVDIQSVFNQYFEGQKPFGPGKKKSEFPDAFVVKSIENRTITDNKSTILISGDPDMKEYESESDLFEIYDDISSVLDRINSSIEEYEEKIAFIKSTVPIETNAVEQYLDKNYTDGIAMLVHDKLLYDADYPDVEYDDPSIKGVYIDNIDIIKIEDEAVQLNLSISVILNITISYSNYDFASYDREDGRWYNVETTTEHKEYNLDIEAITIFMCEEDGDTTYFDFEEIEEINLIDYTE